MPLNTADQLRFFINDKPRWNRENFYGDGTSTIFKLQAEPLVSGTTSLGAFQPSAFVPIGGSAWSATGAAFDYNLGTVTLPTAIQYESAFMVHYSYATFADSEIDLVTAMYGDIPSMRLSLIDNLMGDAYKRQRWASERGGFYDESNVMKNLMMMRSAVMSELYDTPAGTLVQWGNTQAQDTDP